MIKISILFFIAFFPYITIAQINDTQTHKIQVNKRLDQFYQVTQSFQSDFEQTIQNSQGKILETSSGNLIVSKPDKFLLEYNFPAQQKYISNGKTIWIYDVELEQVSIKQIDEGLGDSPALLLSSNANIYNHYAVSNVIMSHSEGLSWVQLLAKEQEMIFEKVFFAFKDNVLKQMIMHDSFGQITELKFSNTQINKPFANRQFNFVPPDDVDVIGSVGAQ